MTKRVVVVGAGIGGKLAARGIKNKFPEFDVFLVGPEDCNERPGLFYFNRKIPGICEKKVEVTYGLVGEGTMKDYQIKSRGYFDRRMVNSSFKNIGKTVEGYLVNREISFEDINRIVGEVSFIDLEQRFLYIQKSLRLDFDYVIVTVPLKVLLKIMSHENLDGVNLDDIVKEFKCAPVYQKVAGFQKVSDNHIDSIKVFYDLSSSGFYRHSSYYHGDCITRMVSESIHEFEEYDLISYPGKITPSIRLTEIVNTIEERFDCIKICGRYARWSYHYLVDQTYFDSISFIESKTKSA